MSIEEVVTPKVDEIPTQVAPTETKKVKSQMNKAAEVNEEVKPAPVVKKNVPKKKVFEKDLVPFSNGTGKNDLAFEV